MSDGYPCAPRTRHEWIPSGIISIPDGNGTSTHAILACRWCGSLWARTLTTAAWDTPHIDRLPEPQSSETER